MNSLEKANASPEVTADSGIQISQTSPKGGLRRWAGGEAGRQHRAGPTKALCLRASVHPPPLPHLPTWLSLLPKGLHLACRW